MSYISMFCDEDLSREIDTARSDEEIYLLWKMKQIVMIIKESNYAIYCYWFF